MALVLGEVNSASPSPRVSRQACDEKQARLPAQEGQRQHGGKGKSHSRRGHQARLHSVGELSRVRGEEGHDQRLGQQDQPGLIRLQPFDVLQIEAEQEGYGKGGGIADEGRQIGECIDAIISKEAHIQHGTGHARLPADEQEKGRRSQQDQRCALATDGRREKPNMTATSIRL